MDGRDIEVWASKQPQERRYEVGDAGRAAAYAWRPSCNSGQLQAAVDVTIEMAIIQRIWPNDIDAELGRKVYP